MNDVKLDDRTILRGSSEFVPLPDRPTKSDEARAAERKADRVEQSALLAERQWSVEQLQAAQSQFGFPAGARFWSAGWRPKASIMFSRSEIAAWDRGLSALLGR